MVFLDSEGILVLSDKWASWDLQDSQELPDPKDKPDQVAIMDLKDPLVNPDLLAYKDLLEAMETLDQLDQQVKEARLDLMDR